MPTWGELQSEISASASAHDLIRRRYLKDLHELTGRNVIAYYSGWLEKAQFAMQGLTGFELNDSDKSGFMSAIHGLDKSRGLDLMLHTPGGNIAATESLVQYLRSIFGSNIRAIVPQIAMSAGTMIALACQSVVMGKHSNLGPIDPQFGNLAAHGVVEEFEQARRDISENPASIPLWQPILAKYSPTFIGECQKAISWSTTMVSQWLRTGMFSQHEDPTEEIERIIGELGSHALTLSHDRHISAEQAQALGVEVEMLEDNDAFQEAVLTVHHAYVLTLAETPAFKIIENHQGASTISAVQVQAATAFRSGPPMTAESGQPAPADQ